MEWQLSGNNESSLILLFTVLGTFGTLLGGFGSLLMLQPSQVRKLLLALLILVGVTEVFLVGLGINLRLAKASAAEKNKVPQPRSGLAPRPSPKEVENISEGTEEQAMASGVRFNISSRSDASIRQRYCVDGVVTGTFYRYAGHLMVKLDTADFDLCKYSSDGQRAIEFRLGIGTRSDIAKKNWNAIWWSQPQRGSVSAGAGSQIAPEKPLEVPMKRFGKNKASADLTNYGVVVSVYNPDRHGLYYLSDKNN